MPVCVYAGPVKLVSAATCREILSGRSTLLFGLTITSVMGCSVSFTRWPVCGSGGTGGGRGVDGGPPHRACHEGAQRTRGLGTLAARETHKCREQEQNERGESV